MQISNSLVQASAQEVPKVSKDALQVSNATDQVYSQEIQGKLQVSKARDSNISSQTQLKFSTQETQVSPQVSFKVVQQDSAMLDSFAAKNLPISMINSNMQVLSFSPKIEGNISVSSNSLKNSLGVKIWKEVNFSKKGAH